ncbi:MAG: hypothetical protein ACPGUV_13035, partial [Polyangiales bacterium]
MRGLWRQSADPPAAILPGAAAPADPPAADGQLATVANAKAMQDVIQQVVDSLPRDVLSRIAVSDATVSAPVVDAPGRAPTATDEVAAPPVPADSPERQALQAQIKRFAAQSHAAEVAPPVPKGLVPIGARGRADTDDDERTHIRDLKSLEEMAKKLASVADEARITERPVPPAKPPAVSPVPPAPALPALAAASATGASGATPASGGAARANDAPEGVISDATKQPGHAASEVPGEDGEEPTRVGFRAPRRTKAGIGLAASPPPAADAPAGVPAPPTAAAAPVAPEPLPWL